MLYVREETSRLHLCRARKIKNGDGCYFASQTQLQIPPIYRRAKTQVIGNNVDTSSLGFSQPHAHH